MLVHQGAAYHGNIRLYRGGSGMPSVLIVIAFIAFIIFYIIKMDWILTRFNNLPFWLQNIIAFGLPVYLVADLTGLL
jgi:hypothetical protein